MSTAEIRRSFEMAGRAGSAALLVLAWLAGGCASVDPEDLRVEQYRPDVEDVDSSEWDIGSSRRPGDAAYGASDGEYRTARGEDNELSGRRDRVLKRGDAVTVKLTGIPKPEDIKDMVDDEGMLNLSLIGRVSVEAKTTSQAEDIIEKAYIDRGYYRKITAIVVAQEDEYYVQGEVKREGRYPLTRDMTLLQAVATAGGYTDFANRTRVKVTNGDEVETYNLKKIEQMEEKDPLVKPGDLIRVPRRIIL